MRENKKENFPLCVAGKRVDNFVSSPVTQQDVKRTSEILGLPEDQIIVGVPGTGAFSGTWIHRDLAFALALYCDSDGTRGVRATVSRALAAYADCAGSRAPAPPVPTMTAEVR